jgi:membrane associated rhomboid family serine protease
MATYSGFDMDLSSINQTFQTVISSSQANLPLMAKMVGVVFFIQVINAAIGYRLCAFGILPRHPIGLIGIPLSPLIHASFNHFFSNAIIFFALANLVALEGTSQFLLITAIITVIGGFATWLLGRAALHVGASGLIMGYWGYLLVNAYHHPTLITIALGVVCIYFFGGMLSNMIPDSAKESWEGHVFGVFSGVLASFAYPYVAPYLIDDLQNFERMLHVSWQISGGLA